MGVIHQNWMNSTKQFIGIISNLNLFFEENFELQDLSENICNEKVNANIPWNNMKGIVLGDIVAENDIDLKYICAKDEKRSITLPFKWDLHSAMEACGVLGNGTIFFFDKPENLTGVDFEYFYGKNFYNYQYYWTPINDVQEEGVYRNEYDGSIIKDLDWAFNQPNGGTEENNVVLATSELAFIDADGQGRVGTGLTCSVFKNSVITIRGGCMKSLIGNEKMFYLK